MRIGFLTEDFPILSQTFVVNLAASLADAGHDLRIFSKKAGPPDGWQRILEGTEELATAVIRPREDGKFPTLTPAALAMRQPSRLPLIGALALAGVLSPKRYKFFRMFMEQDAFDIVHAQFATTGRWALPYMHFGALRTKAFVVHLRGHDVTSFVEARSPDIYTKLFRKADLFIANSQYFRDRAIALGCSGEKIVVIGSPIDTDRFAPPPSRKPLDGRDVRLVAVGRLVEKKGFADAIEAMALLVAEGRHVKLDIHGEGPSRPDLENRIARHGLGSRVRLHGAASWAQVRSALHCADIALAPSVTATSGDADGPVNTAKEAMATGLPIIATRHGGIPELVIPGVNGDLVPEGEPVSLAASIARMIDNPLSWEALGRAGRAKVVTEYSQRSILEKTVDAYETALMQRRSG